MTAPIKAATIAALAALREAVLSPLATLREHGWCNAHIAARLHVPPKTLRRWRAGTTPRAIYADNLLALLVPVQDFENPVQAA